jgi:translation elongation factor EF-G
VLWRRKSLVLAAILMNRDHLMLLETFVRNFCIIAYINHGKTTLSDRLLEYTHTLQQRDRQEQAKNVYLRFNAEELARCYRSSSSMISS